MVNAKLSEALNLQIKHEFYSAYLYLAMAAYFESLSLKGCAHWMHLQAKEELGHGMKIFAYLGERGNEVNLLPIEAPIVSWSKPLEAFQASLKHEQKVTAAINGLVELALAEKDQATYIFLHWFVKEQVEEEANVSEIINRLELTKDCSCGLLIIDKKLGKRE